MQSDVDLETALCREHLVAHLTLELLQPHVRLDVRRQRALDGERPEALATLVGLLVGVDADVTHEVARLLELLRAVGALVPADAVHLRGTRRQADIGASRLRSK